jgi:predicted transposase YbfD/YdcC
VELLKSLVLKGKVVVADAAYCQRDFCESVQDGEAEYLVFSLCRALDLDNVAAAIREHALKLDVLLARLGIVK